MSTNSYSHTIIKLFYKTTALASKKKLNNTYKTILVLIVFLKIQCKILWTTGVAGWKTLSLNFKRGLVSLLRWANEAFLRPILLIEGKKEFILKIY